MSRVMMLRIKSMHQMDNATKGKNVINLPENK